jgi:hypothetical protein
MLAHRLANPAETDSVHFDPRIVLVLRSSPEINPRVKERFVPRYSCVPLGIWFAVEISSFYALAMYSIT